MKKLLLFFIGVLLSISMYSQGGATCATALNFTEADAGTSDERQISSALWYVFPSASNELRLVLQNRQTGAGDEANKITLWGGSCAGLTSLGTDTLSSPTDSILIITVTGLTAGTTYYLQVEKFNNTSIIEYSVGRKVALADPSCGNCSLPIIADTCDLVCNGNFESNTIPSGITVGNFNYAGGPLLTCAWENATMASPDYFSTTYTSGDLSIPSTFFGTYTAHSGSGMAGFIATQPSGWHEYVYSVLKCPLDSGKKYDVSFWVRCATTMSTNSIGLWLTDVNNYTFNTSNYLDGQLTDLSGVPIVPQVPATSAGFITGGMGWTQIRSTFTATGLNENLIVIGNFGSTSSGSSANAYYFLDDVSINPIDSIFTLCSDADSTICDGQSVTLQSQVIDSLNVESYYWTSIPIDTSLIGQDSMSIITVTPHDTTIYYSSIVVGSCNCTLHDTIQINVIPLPVMPLVVGDSFACVTGTPIPYTITNYDSSLVYTITFLPLITGAIASAVDSTGTFTVTWSDNNGAIIVVTVGDSTSGCDSLAEFLVKSCCIYGDTTFINDSASAMLAYYISGGLINGQSFSINGTFTIDQNMTWSNNSIKLGVDAVINILPGYTLYLTQKTEMSACSQMWDKIQIQPGGKLIMDGNSIIEDAKTAIYSIAGGEYKLNNARLNRNFKDIELTPYSVGPHLGTIVNTRLTCSPILGTIATLNPPYIGYRTQVGIEMNGVQSVTIGISTGVSYENLFKNMNTGILANRSSVKVYGNNFKNIDLGVFPNSGVAAIRVIGNPLPPFPFTGYVARSLTVGDGTTLGFNSINNCINGIVTEQNVNVNISYNDIKNTALRGITIKNNKVFQTVSISKNNIIDFSTGISCEQNNICTTSITLNLIKGAPSAFNTTGIALTDINSNSASYTIFNNDIEKVSTGLNSKSVTKLVVDGNRITIKPVTGFLPNGRGVFLSNNISARVTSNIIKCVPPTTTVTNVKGVFIQDCPNTLVKCNEVHNFGASIHFDGPANTFGTVYNNLMKNATYGFWLSNGVALGNQGGPAPTGVASDNKWQGTFTQHTFVSGTIPTFGNNSKLFYRNIGIYVPIINTPASGAGVPMIPQPVTPTNPISFCAYPIPGGAGHKAMLLVAKDSVYTTQQLKWLSKHAVYRELKADSTLISGDTLLVNFKDSLALQNMGKLYDALQVASENNVSNFVTAKNSINALTITEPIEDYLKTVIDMALEKQITGVDFGSGELSTLRNIAAMCPYNEGTGVYIARSLLVPYDAIGTEYENTCETDGTRTMSFVNDEPVTNIADNKFLLFPNPNNGSMTLNYEISETDNASLFIYDITGRVISNYKMNANNNSLVIKENELSNGIYLYKVIINGKTAKSDRLVIIK